MEKRSENCCGLGDAAAFPEPDAAVDLGIVERSMVVDGDGDASHLGMLGDNAEYGLSQLVGYGPVERLTFRWLEWLDRLVVRRRRWVFLG